METIIYAFLEKNDAGNGSVGEMSGAGTGYQRQEFDMGDYRLVQVKVSRELWRILQEREPERNLSEKREEGTVFPWTQLWKKRKERLERERYQRRLTEEAGFRRQFLQELLVDREHSCFVTEEPVPFLEGWSFRGYLEEEWVLHMMQYASGNYFVILGRAECLPRLLLAAVRRMKGLSWFLTERQFGEAERGLVEELYEEYGLAVEVRLLKEEKNYRSLRFAGKNPSVVIDFCEEERVSVAELAKGSIWLDMTASEVKRYRIEERKLPIYYFSLKKEWKQPQKAPNYLDTISKNGYNT